MRSCSREENAYYLLAFFLDSFLPDCDHLFAIDCSPHVRLHLRFHIAASFRNQVLIHAASIAIWNRNKVIVTLAITVWGISAAFHVQSKPLPPHPSCRRLGFPYKCGWKQVPHR
jgi:hypothetical protein